MASNWWIGKRMCNWTSGTCCNRVNIHTHYRIKKETHFSHKDGSLKFWQETGEHLQILYKLKSSSHFERLEEMETSDKVSHAVKYIELCLEVI